MFNNIPTLRASIFPTFYPGLTVWAMIWQPFGLQQTPSSFILSFVAEAVDEVIDRKVNQGFVVFE